MVYTLRFCSLQNTVCFIILTYLVPALFTFYILDVLKFKKNNSGTKRFNGYYLQDVVFLFTEEVTIQLQKALFLYRCACYPAEHSAL